MLELLVVYLLCSPALSHPRKLQLLFLLATVFISFRLFAFHGLFVGGCGCLGPITRVSEHVGRSLEVLSVLFLLSILAGYPLFLMMETLALNGQGHSSGDELTE